MADALGLLTKMSIRNAGSWAAGWLATTIKIPFISESIISNYTRIEDDSLTGSGGRNESYQGVEAVPGSSVHVLDYNNFDLMLESFFGTVGGRVFEFSEDSLPKWLHLAIYKQVSNWRLSPAKLTKLVISGEKDGFVRATFDWLVKTVVYQSEAADSTALVGLRTKIRFEDMLARFAEVSAGVLDNGDNKRLESFELTLDRGLVPDDYASKSSTVDEVKRCLEPIPNAFRDCALKIKLPRYSTDGDFVTWKADDEPLQGTLLFTLGSETMLIELPHMKVADGFSANVGGAERLQLEGGLTCYGPESTNPLYTGGECRITLT